MPKMISPSDRALDFIDSLDSEKDSASLTKRFIRVAESLGLPSFFCGQVVQTESNSFALEFLASQWPEKWKERYWEEKNYVRFDPVASAMPTAREPVVWADAPHVHGAMSKLVMDEASEFGLADGVAFTIASQPYLVVSLASATKLDRSVVPLAHLCSMYFAIKLETILSQTARPQKAVLTSRERDCLSLAAQGKNDWETSCILGISQYTASQHIASAMRKLSAVNRTQAVAQAIFLREIVL